MNDYWLRFGELLLVALVLVIASRLTHRGKDASNEHAIVLQKFKVDNSATDDVFVDLAGRASGFVGWMLAATGLEAGTTFTVTSRGILFSSSHLSGVTHRLIPLPDVASVRCGYYRPTPYAIAAVLLVFAGLVSRPFVAAIPDLGTYLTIIGFFLGAVLLILYWFGKRMFVAVETCGGTVFRIIFAHSVIEDVQLNVELALQAIVVINRLATDAQARGSGARATTEERSSSVWPTEQYAHGRSDCEL